MARKPPPGQRSDGALLSAAAVRYRYGISATTLWTWRHDPTLAFPEGIRINGRNYFRREDLVAWEMLRSTSAAGRDEGSATGLPAGRSPHPLGGALTPPMQSFEELVAALKRRRLDLGMTLETLEHISGLQDGYATKLEAPPDKLYARAIGRTSMPLWLGGLGVGLVLVDVQDQRQRDFRMPRKSDAAAQ